MELILIRHAHAGERGAGGRDRYRPLSDRGAIQAAEIARALASYQVSSVLSSPASRCVQTVIPLAQALGLEVVEDEDLWEASTDDDVARCLNAHLSEANSLLAGTPNTAEGDSDSQGAVVACSHGNIIPPLVEAAAAQGAEIDGRGCERGSIWIVTFDGGRPVRASYLSPRKNYRTDGTL